MCCGVPGYMCTCRCRDIPLLHVHVYSVHATLTNNVQHVAIIDDLGKLLKVGEPTNYNIQS